MEIKSILRDVYFWLSSFIIFLTDLFFFGTIYNWFDFGIVIGPYRLNHWLSWIGFLFILIHVPLFVTLKRRFFNKINSLL